MAEPNYSERRMTFQTAKPVLRVKLTAEVKVVIRHTKTKFVAWKYCVAEVVKMCNC